MTGSKSDLLPKNIKFALGLLYCAYLANSKPLYKDSLLVKSNTSKKI